MAKAFTKAEMAELKKQLDTVGIPGDGKLFISATNWARQKSAKKLEAKLKAAEAERDFVTRNAFCL